VIAGADRQRERQEAIGLRHCHLADGSVSPVGAGSHRTDRDQNGSDRQDSK